MEGQELNNLPLTLKKDSKAMIPQTRTVKNKGCSDPQSEVQDCP